MYQLILSNDDKCKCRFLVFKTFQHAKGYCDMAQPHNGHLVNKHRWWYPLRGQWAVHTGCWQWYYGHAIGHKRENAHTADSCEVDLFFFARTELSEVLRQFDKRWDNQVFRLYEGSDEDTQYSDQIDWFLYHWSEYLSSACVSDIIPFFWPRVVCPIKYALRFLLLCSFWLYG